MNFKNPELLTELNKLPSDYDNDGDVNESKINEFVGKHFIPNAKDNNFSAALIELMQATNQLPEIISYSKQSVADQQSHTSFKPILITLGYILLIFIAVLFFIRLFIFRKEKRGKLNTLIRDIQVQQEEVYSSQQRLRSLSSILTGTTFLDMSNYLKKELDLLASENSQLLIETQRIQVPFLKSDSFNNLLYEKNKALNEFETRIKKVLNDTTSYINFTKEIENTSERVRQSLQEVEHILQDIPTSSSTTIYQQRVEDLKLTFCSLLNANTDRIEVIAAKLKEVYSKVFELKGEIDQIADLFQEKQDIPLRIQKYKEQVDRLLFENHLKVIEFDPYQYITKAEKVFELLFQPSFEAGNISESIKYSKEVACNLRTAINEVESRIALKKEVIEEMKNLEKACSTILITNDLFESQYAKIKELYTENHWVNMKAKYIQRIEELRLVRCQLETTRDLASDSTQKYSEAIKMINATTAKMSDIESTLSEFSQSSEILEGKINKYRAQFNLLTSKLREIAEQTGTKLINNPSVIFSWERCNSLREMLEELVDVRPYNLDLIENKLDQYQYNVVNLEKDLTNLKHAKEEVEKKNTLLKKSYKRMNRSRDISSSIISQARTNMNEIDTLILNGAYGSALTKLIETEQLIQDNTSDYSVNYSGNILHDHPSSSHSSSYSSSSSSYSSDSYSYYDSSSSDNSSGGGDDGGNSSGGDNW